ncbi:MAG: hypothetical protein LBL75_04035 [Rickettsiales bacterium]|jgi:hypothetical protein|nr:hypothetical protein [Rickettsiales bacterium]
MTQKEIDALGYTKDFVESMELYYELKWNVIDKEGTQVCAGWVPRGEKVEAENVIESGNLNKKLKDSWSNARFRHKKNSGRDGM